MRHYIIHHQVFSMMSRPFGADTPVHTFHESLPDSLQLNLIIKLGRQFLEPSDSMPPKKIYQLLADWCSTEQHFHNLSIQKSLEEIVSTAFKSGLFEDIFASLPERFEYLEKVLGALEAAATLSSAELN